MMKKMLLRFVKVQPRALGSHAAAQLKLQMEFCFLSNITRGRSFCLCSGNLSVGTVSPKAPSYHHPCLGNTIYMVAESQSNGF